MMSDIKELNKKVEVSLGAIVFTIIGIVMGTFTLTTIYNEFLHQQRETIRVETLVISEISRVEGRLDKITKRATDRFEKIEKKIEIDEPSILNK